MESRILNADKDNISQVSIRIDMINNIANYNTIRTKNYDIDMDTTGKCLNEMKKYDEVSGKVNLCIKYLINLVFNLVNTESVKPVRKINSIAMSFKYEEKVLQKIVVVSKKTFLSEKNGHLNLKG